MNILITGINGSLGINTAIQLYEKGYKIIGYGHAKNVNHPIINDIEFVEGDLLEKEKLKTVISKANVIFHFGALTGYKKSMSDYINSNILGTGNIIDIINEHEYPIEKIIFASSSAVYGEGAYECDEHGILSPKHRKSSDLNNRIWNLTCQYCDRLINPIPTNENSKQYGHHIYGITKQTCERILNSLSILNKIIIINLRFSILYGNFQKKGIIPLIYDKISSGQEIKLNEDGNQIRDFIFLSDAASMIILAMENMFKNGTYNISSNSPTTLLSLVNIISKSLNKKVNINITQKYRSGDIRHLYMDNNKIIKALNCHYKTDIVNGINDMTSS